MLHRHFNTRLRRLLKQFPVVCLLGPRQAGKTTFIKAALPRWRYLDLEKPSDLVQVSQDPERALARLDRHFILDEAQQLPELFPVLRSAIDDDRRPGRLVLLGSASPSLSGQIAESLAGRAGFLDITPFQWRELQTSTRRLGLETLWLRGGLPDAMLATSNRTRLDWFDAYTRTFIERDLTALGIAVTLSQMRKLWTMLAHFHGNIWNASRLAASMGTTYHTINRYTDILEQTFLVRKLPPYYANIGKRLVKSPKIYLRDSGILHYFIGVHDAATLEVHPNRGASWEGFVIEQLVNAFRLELPAVEAFYWRTARGEEVDLLIRSGRRLLAFEVKLHTAPTRDDAAGLRACMRDLDLTTGYVLHAGNGSYPLGDGIEAVPARVLLSDYSRLHEL